MANEATKIQTVWNGDVTGKGNIKADVLNTDLAVPEAFGGSGAGTNPKELLISSATACFTMTLVSILNAIKMPVDNISIDTEAVVSKEEGTKIHHKTTVTLAADVDEKQIVKTEKSIDNANSRCEVGNILRQSGAEITAEANVIVK